MVAAILLALAGMVFVRIGYVYPSRTPVLRGLTNESGILGALTVRTNFFGWGHRYRQSFSDWIYYGLKAGERLTMFDDVFITPILADRLAAFAHALTDSGASGTMHVGSLTPAILRALWETHRTE